jgi:hypothetical protein
MSQPNDLDKDMWKAYAKVIQGWAGDGFNPKSHTFFPASLATQGVVAGKGISRAITNYQLSLRGNGLLRDGDAFYRPGSENGYIQEIR